MSEKDTISIILMNGPSIAHYCAVGIAADLDKKRWCAYHILQLPLEAQKRHIRIVNELRLLEANGEITYSQDSFTINSKEINTMIQQLREDYYQFHELQMQLPEDTHQFHELQIIFPEDLHQPQQSQAQDKKKRVRRVPTAIEAKGSDCINFRSDVLGYRILYALKSKDDYAKVKGHDIALYRQEFDVTLRERGYSKKEQAQLMITIEPQKDEGWETILTALNTLGDGCMDTFTALMAIAIERNGIDKMRMPFEISPDDILAVCKKEKSKGSYKISQKAEIVAHLKTLSQAHVIATIPTVITRKRKGKDVTEKTVIKAEGAILDLLSFKIGEYSTITGEEIWEKREVSIGAWAEMMPGINASTATMLRQVLAYKAKNQRYQKRIGRYLTLMFRFNARRGGSFPHGISMGALLTSAGIEPPRQQGEFKEAIEHALEDLKRDNVIGDYWRIIEETPEAIEIDKKVEERARGWFDYYLKQIWNFKPPVILQEQYKKLLQKASEDDSGGN